MAGKLTVRWRYDLQLSVIHAAYVVATDSVCSDARTQAALVQPATNLNNRLLSASIDVAEFWHQLISQHLDDGGNARALEVALLQAGCSELQLEQTAGAIANCLGECRLAFQKRFPKLTEQLKLRSKPLRDGWDKMGQQLLDNIARTIWKDDPPDEWWPPRVDGLLVQPLRGGDGDFDVASRTFWIEALLSDIDPEVPEVLRIAWLLTQLAIELQMREKSSETVTGMPWSLAAIPIVLSAAGEMGLSSGDMLPIAPACSLWRIGDDSTAQTVQKWWLQWLHSDSPMPVALKALDRMLHPDPQPGSGINLLDFSD